MDEKISTADHSGERPEGAGTSGALVDIAKLALKLGFTAFGGPAAHIAMLRNEVVSRHGWISDQHFLDLMGATNLIPGPNSTEMVMHTGQLRAGWRGLVVAGSLFILPASLIVLSLAWFYVQYGSTPAAEWLLYGIKPVIIAIIAQALWGLIRTAIKSVFLAAIAIGVLALYLFGFNEIGLLFGAGLFVMVALNLRRLSSVGKSRIGSVLPVLGFTLPGITGAAATSFSLPVLFLTFLKIGAVLYGSGYVLLAFLRTDFVERLHWITNQQLLDAVAIGQFTPGPVSTTATFVGYVTGGVPGAALATLGIFLPSFVFVAVVNPLVPRLRRSLWMSAFLDGVNAASLSLMAAVTWQLGRAALVDLVTVALALVSAVLLIRFKVNSVWLILGGGVVGIGYRLLFGR